VTLTQIDLPLEAPQSNAVAQRAPANRTGQPTPSLKRNFSWTFAGNVAYAGCQWAMLVVLAKLGSPEMVGQFALGLAVTAPIIMLSNLQLRGVLATDAKEEYSFADYLTLRIVCTVAAVVVIAVVVAWSGYRRETGLVILAIALAKACESISDIAYGALQHQERMDRVARSLALRGTLAVAVLWIAVYLTGSVLIGSVGLAIGWGAVVALYDLPALKGSLARPWWLAIKPGPTTNWRKLAGLATVAAPLGVVMMLLSLNTNLPRYVIQHQLGERALGIFAAIAYLMVAGTTVVGALGQSASPRLAQFHAAGDIKRFRILLAKLAAIAGALGIGGILVAVAVGGPLLRIMFRADYAAAGNVLIWMMIAAAFSYVASALGYGLTASRRFKIQAPLNSVVIVVTAVSSVLLIPRHGLVGASVATLLGAIAQLVATACVVWGWGSNRSLVYAEARAVPSPDLTVGM
jgi:O-antigen/teichoic acid export membrane protein